ncbi:MAG TPA: DUF4440 domain-containing protein, partial [Parvularculaceae bacterium]|nr:DUF4440 domain-containing protein [Parvularculaceae bacterium]
AASGSGRPPEDIIRSVLLAEAAAWNEGDLDAFMGGYWNSPQTRLVSGASTINGWADIQKHYRERYGTSDSMGRLGYEGLDVTMVSGNVAIVDGRYTLTTKDGAAAGSFSLVMKRFDGLWRIVHDVSTSDSKPTE